MKHNDPTICWLPKADPVPANPRDFIRPCHMLLVQTFWEAERLVSLVYSIEWRTSWGGQTYYDTRRTDVVVATERSRKDCWDLHRYRVAAKINGGI